MQRKPSIMEMLADPKPTTTERPPSVEPPPSKPAAKTEPAANPLPSMDDLDPLPQPGAPYKAYGRLANQMLPTLHILMADATSEGFAYSNLDKVNLGKSVAGQGPAIVLRFYGVIPTEVTLTGRNLAALLNAIALHRVLWVRQLREDQDFRGLLADGEPVITGVTISEVKKAES